MQSRCFALGLMTLCSDVRAVKTDTAMRLGRYFGMSLEFWINLQTRYDLDLADRTLRRKIEQEVAPRNAA